MNGRTKSELELLYNPATTNLEIEHVRPGRVKLPRSVPSFATIKNAWGDKSYRAILEKKECKVERILRRPFPIIPGA
jgi:hypothetical protein